VDRLLQRGAVAIGRDGNLALHDCRTGIDPLVDEVDGDPGHLDPRRERLPDRVEAGEGGQQRRVDIDDATPEAGDELRAEQLHVAGERDKVGAERLDPVADRVIARRPVGVLVTWEDRSLDPGRPRPLQRPRRRLVRADPDHLDPLTTVQPVEDRLQVRPRSRGQDDDAKTAHPGIIAKVAFLENLGIEVPVVQAGLGGGLSRHELAVAVSEAGGLGTIAVIGAEAIEAELAAARKLTGRPLAVNLLLPFAEGDWFAAAAGADVVVTFWGEPERRVAGAWIHQCGSVEEAEAAHAAGADAVIVQGVEAGGHVRGTTPALELLEQVRAALPSDYPLLLAGGIAERADVEQALDAGASAAVAGTRFLLSEESRAHREYKRRLLDAEDTILTDLFGLGWPAPHRVVPNAATKRGGEPLPPLAATDDGPAGLVDDGPLYAGQAVARIAEVRPAAEIVDDLMP
jgi:nitronate monooxygenase